MAVVSHFLVRHKRKWEKWFNVEREELQNKVPQNAIKNIYHIGSTALNKIKAKNIVDILVITNTKEDMISVKNSLVENGYICMLESENRISLNKGYTIKGFSKKVFHIHLRLPNDNDELYFKDYLLENYDIAKEYEKLKISLAKKFKFDRDGYTDAKTEFINKYTSIAKEQYKERY